MQHSPNAANDTVRLSEWTLPQPPCCRQLVSSWSPAPTALVRSIMRRRTFASFTAMNALTSSSPSEVPKKSVIDLELVPASGLPESGPEGTPS
jgi:hypothetical protein